MIKVTLSLFSLYSATSHVCCFCVGLGLMGDLSYLGGGNPFPLEIPMKIQQLRVLDAPAGILAEAQNRTKRGERILVEWVYGCLKNQFMSFGGPWKHELSLFPRDWLVCCMLVNRFHRLHGYPRTDQDYLDFASVSCPITECLLLYSCLFCLINNLNFAF